jgi:hypothetical protein
LEEVRATHYQQPLVYYRIGSLEVIYVFEGEKIITVFSPPNLKKYFKAKTIEQTVYSKSIKKGDANEKM